MCKQFVIGNYCAVCLKTRIECECAETSVKSESKTISMEEFKRKRIYQKILDRK